jgi:enamine deaminase RidA (YjgF/YER057c/UK114 family)
MIRSDNHLHRISVANHRPAVRTNQEGLLEISGFAAYDEHGQELFPGDLSKQTHYVLGLMRQVLESAGLGFESVARLSVFTTDLGGWPSVWKEIESIVAPTPALSVVEISSLVGPVGMVEMEITAALPHVAEQDIDPQEIRMSPSERGPAQSGAVAVVPKSLADRDWELHTAAFLMGKGDLVFLSGTGPLDSEGNTVGRGDAGAQTRQIISAMSDILEEAGGSLDDIVRLRVFTPDMSNRPQINAERMRAFKEPRAVSTFVQVSALEDPDWLVMFEATAFIPKHAG